MTEELKQGDEVWVRVRVTGFQTADDLVAVEFDAPNRVFAYPKLADIRKSLPEMNEAKERVVEAARVWRHTKPGTEDDEEAISVLSQAVNALEAAEKPSLEEEIKAILVEPYGDLEYTKILTGRILAIVEKHKRRAVMSEQNEVTYLCPPTLSAVMPCCGRTPLEVPRSDRLTIDPQLANCGLDSSPKDQHSD